MDGIPHPALSRRALLTSAPAVGAALALPVTADAAGIPDTPILRLFRQNRAFIEAAKMHQCTEADEDEELQHLFYQHADQLEAEMMALPCTCAADFAAKVIVDTAQAGCYSDWETGALWVEARALTGMVT